MGVRGGYNILGSHNLINIFYIRTSAYILYGTAAIVTQETLQFFAYIVEAIWTIETLEKYVDI